MQIHDPRPGDVVLCRVPDCFDVPEMIKTRPVIVVATRLSGRHGLALIVPLRLGGVSVPRTLGFRGLSYANAMAQAEWVAGRKISTFNKNGLQWFAHQLTDKGWTNIGPIH